LRYVPVFPAWTGPRPLYFFMIENLLEARARSSFPTGSRGPDEDVNVYLAHLLTELAAGKPGREAPGGVSCLGNDCLKGPSGRRPAAERYRRGGDARLLGVGLFGRGDLERRRRVPFGWDEESARQRDLTDGRTCYRNAVTLLERGSGSRSGLVPVLTRLADHFDGYVHVLEVLARDRFDLGARLSDAALWDLVSPPTGEPNLEDPVDTATMDSLLDLLLEYRRSPTPANRQLLAETARQHGIDPERILG